MGLELFRPERDDQDPSYCLDEGFGPDFLQETVRRFSGNIGDFNKPDSYKNYEFSSFTLDIDSAGKSESLRARVEVPNGPRGLSCLNCPL